MKEQHVAEICEKIKKAQSIVMFDYRGLTVEEDTNLRNEMRKNGVEYVVLKNSMVERACRELGVDEKVHEMLKGPSAFAFGYSDPVAPAKILKDFVKKSQLDCPTFFHNFRYIETISVFFFKKTLRNR